MGACVDDSLSLKGFWEAWELFREPALAGAIAGALLGFLGVYVVLRRMVFLSAALSQCAGLGVTLSFYLQHLLGATAVWLSPQLGAVGLTVAATLILTIEKPVIASRRDGILGLTYLVGSSGALAVGTRIVQESHDINAILFGSAVVVLPEDFQEVLYLALGLFFLHLWWRRGFILASFDPDGARVRKLPVGTLNTLLLLSVAGAISICTRILGALPVFAFSVLPALAAIRLASNVSRALLIATVVGAVSGLGGYVLAYLYRLPVGASQALTAAGFVVLTYLLRFAWDTARPAARPAGASSVGVPT